MQKTYHGSCHCGAVKYEVDLDLASGTGKCNCSICWKTRNWSCSTKPELFRLLQGEANLTSYQFNSNSIQHMFCKTCGVKCFGRGDIPEVGGKFVSIQVATLDDLSTDELLAAPVRFYDGLHNAWEREPAQTAQL